MTEYPRPTVPFERVSRIVVPDELMMKAEKEAAAVFARARERKAENLKFAANKSDEEVNSGGMIAEVPARMYYGLDPLGGFATKRGDGGIDFVLNGKVVQVKTTGYSTGKLMLNDRALGYPFDFAILVIPEGKRGDGYFFRLAGYIGKREFVDRTKKKDGEGRDEKAHYSPAYSMRQDDLYPVEWLHYHSIFGDKWLEWWKGLLAASP